jgi:hypothetical protein
MPASTPVSSPVPSPSLSSFPSSVRRSPIHRGHLWQEFNGHELTFKEKTDIKFDKKLCCQTMNGGETGVDAGTYCGVVGREGVALDVAGVGDECSAVKLKSFTVMTFSQT